MWSLLCLVACALARLLVGGGQQGQVGGGKDLEILALPLTPPLASAPVLDRRNSPYAPLYAGYAAATARLRAHEPGPETVAKVVLHALTARRPRARYRVGVPRGTRVVLALPAAVRDAMMRRLYRIRKQPGSGGR